MTENLEAIRRARSEAKGPSNVNMPSWKVPLFSKIRFEYAAGTKVKIVTKATRTDPEMRLRGEIYRNTCEIGMGDSITLINVVNEETGDKFGSQHIFLQAELITIELIQEPTSRTKKALEIALDTHEVTSRRGFSELLSLINQEKEIGVYVPGLSTKMTTTELKELCPTMVLLNVQNTIIVVPTNIVEDESSFWNVFSSRILEKEDIQKILFDSRPLSRFLDSRGLPKLKNRMDLRLFDACASAGLAAKKEDPQTLIRRLKELAQHYLSSFSIEREELWADVSVDEISDISELTASVKKKLAIQTKYLILLKQEILKSIFRVCNDTTEGIAMKTVTGGLHGNSV